MNSKSIVCASAAVAALALAGCGSDSTTEATSSSPEATSTSTSAAASTTAPLTTAPPTPAPPAATGALTIADYLESIGITETPVPAGDPAAPKIDFPVPAGWEQANDLPGDPFWAIRWPQSVAADNPATIQATLTKLSGDVPVGKVFEYAPGELNNLPGYQAMGDGGRASFGGLEAHQMGGLYDDRGTKELVAQKTVMIPAADGPFLLRVRATGAEYDAPALIEATGDLDDNAVITP